MLGWVRFGWVSLGCVTVGWIGLSSVSSGYVGFGWFNSVYVRMTQQPRNIFNVFGSKQYDLPPLRIFKVLPARGIGTDMELPTGYWWCSLFHASQDDKFSDFPET